MTSVRAQQRQLLRTPLEYGFVESSQRVGVWKYYDRPGELGMEIDYGKMELRYMHDDSNQFYVQDGNQWTWQRLLRPCRFHGSQATLAQHFFNSINAPYELRRRAFERGTVIQSILTFDVGPEGVAANPIVTGYTGYGMEKMLRSSFEGAPNVWIPGIKMDRSPATCRFGVSVTICPDSCRPQPPTSYRSVYRKVVSSEPPQPQALATESTGIQFSPDGRWVLVDSKVVAETDGFFVLPSHENQSNAVNRYVPYGHIQSAYWISNREVVFKYKYGAWSPVQGAYDVALDTVWTQSDSVTYFDRISPDLSALCLTGYKKNQTLISKVNLGNRQVEQLTIDPKLRPIPLLWSPDQESIIYKGRKEGMDILYLYEFKSGLSKPLPVMNTEPCGISADGSTLYVYKTNFPFSYYSGEIFSINLKTMRIEELSGKVELLLYVEYSPGADRLLAIRNDKLFLVSPSDMNWIKVANNVSAARWNHKGTHVAYVSEKGRLVNLLTVNNGQTQILLNRFPTKK